MGDQCTASCDPGHVIEQGASRRVCLPDSSWTGNDAICSGNVGIVSYSAANNISKGTPVEKD